MAGVPETIVHVPALQKAAATVEEAGKLLSGAYQPRQAQLVPTDGQGVGWAAASAARTAATSWSGFLGRLASTVGEAAASMNTAAVNYSASDRDAVRLMDKCR